MAFSQSSVDPPKCLLLPSGLKFAWVWELHTFPRKHKKNNFGYHRLPGFLSSETNTVKIKTRFSLASYNLFSQSLPGDSVVCVRVSQPLCYWHCCSVAQSCPTLCDPMDCSTPGFPVFHCLPELAQTHVHWVDDAIQPSHPLSPPPTK